MAGDLGAATQSVNRLVGYILGAVYLLVGVLGLFVANTFADPDDPGRLLGIFRINHLHNIVHLAVGALLVYGATRGTEMARRVNTLVGAVYGVVGVIGLFLASPTVGANILSLNQADNVLHLASAALLLVVAFGTDRTTRRATL